MKLAYIFPLSLLVLAACAPSVKTVNYKTAGQTEGMCELDVFSEGLTVSESYKVLGEVSVRDTGFSINCGEDVIMNNIKTAACEAGADGIQLFNVTHPAWYASTCFQADARFLSYK